jgi:hypothetical protein
MSIWKIPQAQFLQMAGPAAPYSLCRTANIYWQVGMPILHFIQNFDLKVF